MVSFYGEYISEREGYSLIEDEYGFASYIINDAENLVYIRDIFVTANYRRKKNCFGYADKIVELAKARGCTKLVGSICVASNGSTESMKMMLAYGFKLKSLHGSMIYLEKEI